MVKLIHKRFEFKFKARKDSFWTNMMVSFMTDVDNLVRMATPFQEGWVDIVVFEFKLRGFTCFGRTA